MNIASPLTKTYVGIVSLLFILVLIPSQADAQLTGISIDINGDGQNELFACDQVVRFSDTATFKWLRFQNCGSLASPGTTSLTAPPIDFIYSGANFETLWTSGFGTSRITVTNLGSADSLKIAVTSPRDLRHLIASVERFPIAEPSSFQGINFQYDPTADNWLVYSNTIVNPPDSLETNHTVTLTIHDPVEAVVLGDTTAELKDFGVFLRKAGSVEFFPFRGNGQDFRIISGDALAGFFLPSTGSQAKLTATADDQNGKRCRELTNTGNIPLVVNVFSTNSQISLNPGDKMTSCPIGLNPVSENHQPTADSQSVTTNEDTPKIITLSGSDVDGDPLSFAITGTAKPAEPAAFFPPGTLDIKTEHGKVRLSPLDVVNCASIPPSLAVDCTLKVTYLPDANFSGFDVFTFKTFDGIAFSALATVTIEVTPVNDDPVLTVDTQNEATFIEQEDDPERLVIANVRVEDPDLNTNLNQHPAARDQATGLLEQIKLSTNFFLKDGVTPTQAITATFDDGVCDDSKLQVGPGGGDQSCVTALRLFTPAFGSAGDYIMQIIATDRSGTSASDTQIIRILPGALASVTVRLVSGFPPVKKLVEGALVIAYRKGAENKAGGICDTMDKVKAGKCDPFRKKVTNKEGVANLVLLVGPETVVSSGTETFFADYFFSAELPPSEGVPPPEIPTPPPRVTKFWGPITFLEGEVIKQLAQFVKIGAFAFPEK